MGQFNSTLAMLILMDTLSRFIAYLLYNTGARVQEICDVRVKSIRFDPPAVATIRGKGGKTRVVPLWAETAEILHRFLVAKGLADDPDAILFPHSRGECLWRFGVRHIIAKRVAKAANVCPSLAKKRIRPHTFRHTTGDASAAGKGRSFRHQELAWTREPINHSLLRRDRPRNEAENAIYLQPNG